MLYIANGKWRTEKSGGDIMIYLYIILACVLVGVLVWAMTQKDIPVLKYVSSVILCLGLSVSAIYCGVQVNTYYNAKGGVLGFLTGIYNSNKVEVVDDLKFEIKNTELRQVSENVYSLEIVRDTALDLESSVTYGIYVNGTPCYSSESSSSTLEKYVRAEYQYNFYNVDKTLMLNDTLTVTITTNTKYTMLNIKTEGGSEAVKLWNSYFNKNNFIVEIKAMNYVKNGDLQYGEGEIPEICSVKFMAGENNLFKTKLVVKGEKLSSLEDAPQLDGKIFQGWSLDGKLVVDYRTITIQEDTIFYGVFISNAGLYDDVGNLLKTWDDLINGEFIQVDGTVVKGGRYKSSLNGSLVISDTVTEIGSEAFYSSKGLKKVVMPNTITKIGYEAFGNCTSLKKVDMSINLENLEWMAFEGCTSLNSIFIPETVLTIGNDCFSVGNPNLLIYCESSSRQSDWDKNCFYGVKENNIFYNISYEEYLSLT